MQRSTFSPLSKIFIIALLSFFVHSAVSGQPSLSFDLKKPPKFENRALGSEKAAKKKFTVPRRIMQNTITHYNYYFNANNRLNEIIARAKSANRDDYSRLLPFYSYTLQATAGYKNDLDSVIYKSTTGVLIHDLRNDWIDNLYLLIGKAYYLRNDLDSAYLTFQYVNYAFSPKEKDGYDKVIGSNENTGSNAFSISTKEKTGIANRVFSRPPSRNESFIWQIKTYLAKDEFAEAASLIETLKNDPVFPERLQSDLEEEQAYLFYKQQAYDSAAIHLANSLDNAEDKQEQARWEYLIAQLYERTGKSDLAEAYYNKVIRHSLDPVMEVYARVNAIRQNKSGNEKGIQHAVDELVNMARKDRYTAYRDIIYFSAAGIELERHNDEAAKSLLFKSIQFSANNTAQKSKSYLALGNLAFDKKQYSAAKSFYDSIFVQGISADDAKLLVARKASLLKVVQQTDIIERQDSVQRIAALPAQERDAFVKKLYKTILKQRGITDATGEGATANLINNNGTGAAPDLFESNATKGDWYFYNAAAKGKGYSEFRAKWGNRPNVDNWRRQASIQQNVPARPAFEAPGMTALVPGAPQPISMEALLGNLPVTPEKLKVSNDSVETALFGAGKAYMNGLEDYPSAIDVFEKLLNRFPVTTHAEETLFNLYYCYKKAGIPTGEARVKQALASNYPNGKFNALLRNPGNAASPDSVLKVKATRQYEKVYDLFIEGNFGEALRSKKQADSIYGQTYWTPQLLYIEAVYHIKQREDSLAISVLRNIMQRFPANPMSYKASTLVSVLNRRKEIEAYLTKLDVKRPVETDAVKIADDQPVKQPAAVPKTTPPAESEADKIAKSAIVKNNGQPVNKPGAKITAPHPVKPDSLQLVHQNNIIVQDTATRQPDKGAIVTNDKPAAKQPRADSASAASKAPDTITRVMKPQLTSSGFYISPSEAHSVLLVLNKVDPVYVSEARNAFNRYHREQYTGKNLQVAALPFTDDIKLIAFDSFDNAGSALDYVEKTKKAAPVEIIPWLTAQKYSFLIISKTNLEILKNKKDITAYRAFLAQLYPGRF